MDTYQLQYASDLHLNLETAPFNMLIEPVAPDLALCGDIGNPFSSVYANFIKWVSGRWNRVFLIAGNHEYFSENPAIKMEDLENQIRNVAANAGPNVFFLQKEIYRIEMHKIIVIGSTLWTVPSLRRWDKLADGFIGDPGYRGEYNAIYKNDEYTGKSRPLHPSDITALCNEHIAYLTKFLHPAWGSVPEGWRVIVMTHHLPTFLLNSCDFKDHVLKTCYAVSADKLIKEPVVAWLCGHSHTAKTKRMKNGALISLNPLGYKNESATSGYSRKAVISVYRENIAIARNL
jgi:hypothetical protein